MPTGCLAAIPLRSLRSSPAAPATTSLTAAAASIEPTYSSLFEDTTTGGVTINMAAGTVTGDASVGTDTLRSIEAIRGSIFDDVYNATNFGAAGFLNTALSNVGSSGTFNEFEGMAGNDSITGNGNTQIAFYNANAGVTVDLASPTPEVSGSTGIAFGRRPATLRISGPTRSSAASATSSAQTTTTPSTAATTP